MFELAAQLSQSIERSVDYFVRTQHQDGYWAGELEANATITAEYILFRRILGIEDTEIEQAAARQLLAWQVEGGWPIFYGGPPDLNTTIESAVALQMAGLPLDHPALRQATDLARELGGLNQTRVFTRIWLAMLGALSWDEIPAMPVEMMFLPQSSPLNIYRFASWARGTIVPLLVVMAQPPEYHGPAPTIEQFYRAGEERKPEPFEISARKGFKLLDRFLKSTQFIWEHSPLRSRALEKARDWIISHQEADGGWGGIQPAMVYSTLALSTFPDQEQRVRRGIQAIQSFCLSGEDGLRMQSCVSPGWDTPWVMLALTEAGLPGGHPALERAYKWLLGQQSTLESDWSVRAPGVPPGGWPFEFTNRCYPDTDDTALVLNAFNELSQAESPEFERGLQWMLGMQNEDGGWGAFDRANDTHLVEQIPFCDFGEVLDPSSADVTAHILETLGRLGYSTQELHVAKGLRYLWNQQEPDGCWFGRWGVNYVYGTGAVLVALLQLGFSASDPRLSRAIQWLREHQNEDGGWGESCLSYTDPAWCGRGPSTASQTAWALLGLLAVLDQTDDPALVAGVCWLLERQNADGAWDEPQFTGTGFPGDFMIKYHEYRNYFPTLALARYRQKVQEKVGKVEMIAR
jgi:squalene-hopene/tetraprenyl-beta-curcumene cyclase